MREPAVPITVNGKPIEVRAGTSVAAAIIQSGAPSRISISGESRQPLCGIGICYECRARVDGQLHQKTCQIICQPGMEVFSECE